jgi:hypothetical protein
MKEGFGLGVGMSVARNLVDGWFGSKPPAAATAPVPPAQSKISDQTIPRCQKFQDSFDLCVKGAPYDIQTCQKQLDDLNTCLKG